MNRIPPTPELIDAAKHLAAPAIFAAAGIAVVFGFVVWLIAKRAGGNWRNATPAIGVLAIAASAVAVNYFRDNPFPWVPDGKWWHFGGWAVAACFVIELLVRLIGNRGFGFLVRGLTAGIIAHFLVPAAWQNEARWWVPAVAVWLGVSWAITSEVCRKQPGGAAAFAASLFAGGAGIVLLHAKSLGLSDISTGLSLGLFVLALLAWFTRSDAGAAASASVVPVLTLVWLNRPIAESDVPVWCQRILAETPFFAGLMLLPPLKRHLGTRRGGVFLILLILVPVVVAVVLAATLAPMTFDEEKW